MNRICRSYQWLLNTINSENLSISAIFYEFYTPKWAGGWCITSQITDSLCQLSCLHYTFVYLSNPRKLLIIKYLNFILHPLARTLINQKVSIYDTSIDFIIPN